tara:strand:+ start:649 stop:894 length:246 start_codon:yes stop_codon:yes gene_type:complete
MYLESEKVLLKKNYRGYHSDNNTIYVSNNKHTDHLIFEKDSNEELWSVSFPLKLSYNNYKVFFKDKKKAQDYLKLIVNTYI